METHRPLRADRFCLPAGSICRVFSGTDIRLLFTPRLQFKSAAFDESTRILTFTREDGTTQTLTVPGSQSQLSAQLRELDSQLTETHTAGAIRRKAGFTRSVQFDVTNRTARTGSFHTNGDNDGMTYVTGTIRGYDGKEFTLFGIHMAVDAIANERLIEYTLDPDGSPTGRNNIVTGASREYRLCNPSNPSDTRQVNGADGRAIEANEGSQLLYEVVKTNPRNAADDGIDFIPFYISPGNVISQLNNVTFPTGWAAFNLQRMHIVGAPGTRIDRVSFAQHTGYESHSAVAATIGSDVDEPVAWATKSVGAGTNTLTLNGPVDYTGTHDFAGALRQGGQDVVVDNDVRLPPTPVGETDGEAVLVSGGALVYGTVPAGDQGPQGAYRIYIYRRENHGHSPAPATPTGGSVNPTTGAFTPPTSPVQWGSTIDAGFNAATHDLYESFATYNPATSSLGAWAAPRKIDAESASGGGGGGGLNQDEVNLRIRSHTGQTSDAGTFSTTRIPALPQSRITNLPSALAGKANTTHTHTHTAITDFDSEVGSIVSGRIDDAALPATAGSTTNAATVRAVVAGLSAKQDELPTTGKEDDVLQWNGSEWVAAGLPDAPSGGGAGITKTDLYVNTSTSAQANNTILTLSQSFKDFDLLYIMAQAPHAGAGDIGFSFADPAEIVVGTTDTGSNEMGVFVDNANTQRIFIRWETNTQARVFFSQNFRIVKIVGLNFQGGSGGSLPQQYTDLLTLLTSGNAGEIVSLNGTGDAFEVAKLPGSLEAAAPASYANRPIHRTWLPGPIQVQAARPNNSQGKVGQLVWSTTESKLYRRLTATSTSSSSNTEWPEWTMGGTAFAAANYIKVNSTAASASATGTEATAVGGNTIARNNYDVALGFRSGDGFTGYESRGLYLSASALADSARQTGFFRPTYVAPGFLLADTGHLWQRRGSGYVEFATTDQVGRGGGSTRTTILQDGTSREYTVTNYANYKWLSVRVYNDNPNQARDSNANMHWDCVINTGLLETGQPLYSGGIGRGALNFAIRSTISGTSLDLRVIDVNVSDTASGTFGIRRVVGDS